MKIEEWLTDLARHNGLLGHLESLVDRFVRQQREEHQAREREAKRQRIIGALDRTGLTNKDAERLLRWAEPGLLTAEEALHLLNVLHVAIDNVKSGPGLLANLDRSKNVNMQELFAVRRRLHDPATSKSDRLKIAKTMAWWDDVVFSLYMSELEAARNTGSKSPSEIAKGSVAGVVGMGTASVHAACQRVRDESRGQAENLPQPMKLEAFVRWLECGGSLFGDVS